MALNLFMFKQREGNHVVKPYSRTMSSSSGKTVKWICYMKRTKAIQLQKRWRNLLSPRILTFCSILLCCHMVQGNSTCLPCPQRCSCFTNSDNQCSIDCSNLGLVEFPPLESFPSPKHTSYL